LAWDDRSGLRLNCKLKSNSENPMDPSSLVLVALAALPTAILRTFWEAARRPILLAAIVFAFIVSSVLALVLSGVVFRGWWQGFFQNIGVSLLFVGVVNLGILNAFRGLIEGERSQSTSNTTKIDLQGILKALGEPDTEQAPQAATEALADQELLEQVRNALEKVERRLAGSG
jgi:hypothetical protein